MSDNLSKVVVIGISTGGPSTLMEVLPQIPRNLKASIIVIQHMPPHLQTNLLEELIQQLKLILRKLKLVTSLLMEEVF